MKFTRESIDPIASILGARTERSGSDTILYIGGGESAPAIALTVSILQSGLGVLSAQTIHGYFELHYVEHFIPVEPDEVIFVAEQDSRISGLVIGREGACSLFANVDVATISADLNLLEPALLLAAMQLGLVEATAV